MSEAVILEQRLPWRRIAAVCFAVLAVGLIVLISNPVWAFAVAAACLLIPAVLVRPAWGLYPLLVIIAVIPPEGVVGFLHYELIPADLFMMLFALLWAWHKGISGQSIRTSPLLLPISLIVFVRFLSALATPALIQSGLVSSLRYVEWLLVFLIVVDVAQSRDAIQLLKIFLVVVAAQSLLSIAQASGSAALGGKVARGGTLGETGLLLAWLQIYALLVGYSLCHRAPTAGKRVAWAAYTALIGMGLISTLGRTAWVTAAVGLLAYYWLDRTKSLASKVTRAVRDFAVAVVMLGVLFATNRLLLGLALWRTATFASLGEQFSWVERLTLWRLGLDMFVHHPLLGVGTGNYSDVLGQIVGREEARNAHNAIVGVLSETGLVGLVTYLFFAGSIVAMVRRDLRTYPASPLYPYLLPLGSAVVALLFADWIGWTSFVVWSMLFLGLYVVLAREARLDRGHARQP